MQNNNKRIKGADALLLSLIEEGTDTLFGYPGGSIIPLYDHLYDYGDRLWHILTRHEQGAVHAAQGYARVTGRVGVCMATSGPGATNLVTGIADAMIDSTPLVCITAQVACAVLGSDAFQEADMISMTMPITKWNFQITRASEIPEAMAWAFYIARSGRPGPVVIDITKNAQIEELGFNYTPCTYLRSYEPRPKLDAAQVDRAVELINAAKKPLILVGQGVKLAGAENLMIELAESGQIPMAQTLMGISAIPNEHPLFIGNLGMHGNLSANAMTQQSDLIIAVGMRFSDRVTGNVREYAPGAQIIHIDIDASELGKNLPVALEIHADAKDALEALLPGIAKTSKRTEWLNVARERHEEEEALVRKPSREKRNAEGTMGMYDVISTLANEVHGDAIIVTDVGQNQMFSALYSRFNKTRSFITSGGLGTMGFGLPASMGAKLGAADRLVIAVLGDGGFQMTMQELGTIMQNRIGVKILVLNNSFLGMVRQWQQLFFDRRYSFTEIENPDFIQIASAYRIPAKRVERSEDLESGIRAMLEAEGSYFLEVVVRQEDNVFPMVPAGSSLSNILCEE